ncbi:MAG: peptidase [Nitrosopumilaceae archaeon]|nr:peptidase [Nitrosopumilaceae archaeon]
MQPKFFAIPVILILISGTFSLPVAHGQFQSGGVDKPGSWYVGEGLDAGDFFSYRVCHVDYKECTPFEMDFWIKGDRKVGTEDKWIAEVVVYDGGRIITGELELGKVAPEPTGGSIELSKYRGAFKSSIVWLSAFATAYGGEGGEGPKEFSAKSWGKIGNIGGEQVLPTAIETVTVPGGTFESVLVTWRTGGYTSKVWVVDEFPFPVKAATFTHVSEGIPPPEYQFQLLEYKPDVKESPFEGIVASEKIFEERGCPEVKTPKTFVKKPTNDFRYQIHAFYAPEEPIKNCPMKWLIKFISKFDDTEFLNQVQYDLLVVDDKLTPIRSLAQEDARQFLYSPSGQAIVDMIVKEDQGTANYVIWVYGLAPEGVLPTTAPDYLQITLPIKSLDGENTSPSLNIPSWIKNNARWWSNGEIDDTSFVQGIQFLIKEGIMVIPPTAQGTGTGNEIPQWIKNNAGWWADGSISDSDFVQGIQFLIKEGIMRISS